MSLSKTLIRPAMLAIGLIATAGVLSGCGLTPLYADGAQTRQTMALAFPEPGDRLQQIVYQELNRSFGGTVGPDTPIATVQIARGSREITRTQNPANRTSLELSLIGTVTVVTSGPNPKTLINATRYASASYTSNDQSLADRSAETKAAERAAKALAESLRLTILASFATGAAATR